MKADKVLVVVIRDRYNNTLGKLLDGEIVWSQDFVMAYSISAKYVGELEATLKYLHEGKKISRKDHTF